jgi:hypothetical protein
MLYSLEMCKEDEVLLKVWSGCLPVHRDCKSYLIRRGDRCIIYLEVIYDV